MSGAGAPGPLTRLLLESVPAALHGALRQQAELEERLRGYVAAGQAAWPAVALAPETFVRHLGRHLPAEGVLAEALNQIQAADLYLACACAEGDAQALRLFEEHVLQRVPSRLGQLPSAAVDEVLQITRQRLLLRVEGAAPKIADYSGRGALRGWVRIIATRIAGELTSQEGRQELFAEPPEALVQLLAPDDPERDALRADSRQAISEALQGALAALTDRERTLLRLHHLHGLTLERLAAMYGEPRSSVARHVAQARERLLQRVRKELTARLKLEGRELESFLGLVQSRLDLSLNRMMG